MGYKIAHVGAFDFENFGDLLFTDVLYFQLKKRLDIDEIYYFSPTKSIILEKSNNTHSIEQLEEIYLQEHFDAIVVGGGDLVHLDKISVKLPLNKSYTNYNVLYMWTIPSIVANKYDIPLIWNAPGVPMKIEDNQKKIVNVLCSSVDYISVRDEYSKQNLLDANVANKISVVPDSVLSIKELYSKDELMERLSKFNLKKQEYLIFQANVVLSDEELKCCADTLIKIKDERNLEIVLLPIGAALGDLEVLQKIDKMYPGEFHIINRKYDRYDILALISCAEFYIGSSLHGCIVSNAYGVGNIVCNYSKFNKIDGFLRLIHKDEIVVYNPYDIYNKFNELFDKKILDYDSQLKEISTHFDIMSELIEKGSKLQKEENFSTDISEYIFNNNCIEKENNRLHHELELKEQHVINIENIKCSLEQQVRNIENQNCEYKQKNDDLLKKVSNLQDEINSRKGYENKLINRIENIKNHSSVFFGFIDRSNPFQYNDEIMYHIDTINVGKLHLIISGWTASIKTKNQVDIKTRPLLKVSRTIRSDVNQSLDLNNDYKSGFTISGCPWLPMKVKFVDGDNINVYRINGFKWYLKAIKLTFKKVNISIKNNGLLVTLKKIILKLLRKSPAIASAEDYNVWFLKHRITEKELTEQKKKHFNYEPLISVVVPTYNTPKRLLGEMIESIINQSYSNWELCIADGKSTLKETLETLNKYQKKDKRIKVSYLDKNYMISGNTNKAIEMAKGDYIALMDHDDLLELNTLYEYVKAINSNPLVDFIYCDEDKINEKSDFYFEHHFKPDFSLDNIRSNNYITHFSMFKKVILDEVGLYDSKCDGAQDYDMILRVIDYTKNIVHIPKVLYHWRVTDKSTAQSVGAKPYIIEAGRYALEKHLERNNILGSVINTDYPGWYRIKYDIIANPLISIIIPNKDHIDDLDKCLQSIFKKTTYNNYEIIIVENNSEELETFNYYKRYDNNGKVHVVYYNGCFNYSKINNFGFKYAKGEQILLLNNDVEVITPNWLEEMLMFSQREDVGCVGAMLYYPDDTIQHGGVVLGIQGVAGHIFKNLAKGSPGYSGSLIVPSNYSCVTAACMMMKSSVFKEVNGLNEDFAVAFNDVDLCMKIRRAGYLNVFTPYAELYHYESKSRGLDTNLDQIARFQGEINLFQSLWSKELEEGDPFYNKNLTLQKVDYSLKE